jgi:hypothetical protein
MKTVIEMAQEAGLIQVSEFGIIGPFPETLKRFAALVRAAEREACAALLNANAMACENPIYRSLLQSNAAAIRARGQDPMPLFDDWPGGWRK